MAKKRKLDKLDLEMIECEKAGFGCHYGRWKATQPIKKPDPVDIPEDWKTCPYCGKAFKPRLPQQKYCEAMCGVYANREKKYAYVKAYKERKKADAEMMKGSGSNDSKIISLSDPNA